MSILGYNLAIGGALCAAFRAGDNFGFHMGSDDSQCTCQWRPNVNGDPYRGSTRCEQDDRTDDDDDECACAMGYVPDEAREELDECRETGRPCPWCGGRVR